jgi:uncharacterized membrane protein YfcA
VAILIGLAVIVGAMAQRVSGMGFALVAAPVLVLLIGPFDGPLIVNICGAASASLVLTRVWRNVDWGQYLRLVVPAVAAIVPGSIVAVLLGGPILQIGIGGILVLALTASLLVTRTDRRFARTPTAIGAGAASGFMSATAGISGPAVGIYGILTKWEHQPFAATLQPYFVTLGTAAFVGKVVADGGRLPDYDWWLWVLIVACTIVGLTIGEVLSRRISSRVARRVVIAISYLGGIAAIIDGAVALAAS